MTSMTSININYLMNKHEARTTIFTNTFFMAFHASVCKHINIKKQEVMLCNEDKMLMEM